ncbi:MAG: hypothetical protein J3Q66DRAFT_316455, partial [Benniella sp.]
SCLSIHEWACAQSWKADKKDWWDLLLSSFHSPIHVFSHGHVFLFSHSLFSLFPLSSSLLFLLFPTLPASAFPLKSRHVHVNTTRPTSTTLTSNVGATKTPSNDSSVCSSLLASVQEKLNNNCSDSQYKVPSTIERTCKEATLPFPIHTLTGPWLNSVRLVPPRFTSVPATARYPICRQDPR